MEKAIEKEKAKHEKEMNKLAEKNAQLEQEVDALEDKLEEQGK